MEEPQIRFDDGAAYESFMGVWSQLVGGAFLEWLDPPERLRWVDVGCGNGAFTELLLRNLSPVDVQGIDPSEAQIAFARLRLASAPAHFQLGDAMSLPYADAAFDAAVMALVIFFVPQPGRGIAEMVRVVRPGGSVSAYVWDMHGGGFPLAALHEEMAALGTPPLWPPSADVSRMDALRAAWSAAGLVQVETKEIVVARTFADFETFWTISQSGPGITSKVVGMGAEVVDRLRQRLRERLAPDREGRITIEARANAIKGRVPAAG